MFQKNKNKVKDSTGDRIFDIVNVIFMVLLAIVILYPFLNILAISMSGVSEGRLNTVTIFPKEFTLEAYSQIVANMAIWRSYANTIFVAAVGALITVMLTSIAAYPLAFCEFPGKRIYNFFIVITMWFNAGIIPSYMVVRSLGLLDSLWALIIPGALSAYNVIVIRTTFMSVPKSLIEAAKMDGANDWRILFTIVMPLAKAGLAVVALWTIVGHWNNYTGPLLYISSTDKFTLQQILNKIVLNAQGSDIGINAGTVDGAAAIGTQIKYATVMFSMLPVMIAFPFVQKYFVQGALVGSVKE